MMLPAVLPKSRELAVELMSEFSRKMALVGFETSFLPTPKSICTYSKTRGRIAPFDSDNF
jgi:hypothetical protein